MSDKESGKESGRSQISDWLLELLRALQTNTVIRVTQEGGGVTYVNPATGVEMTDKQIKDNPNSTSLPPEGVDPSSN